MSGKITRKMMKEGKAKNVKLDIETYNRLKRFGRQQSLEQDTDLRYRDIVRTALDTVEVLQSLKSNYSMKEALSIAANYVKHLQQCKCKCHMNVDVRSADQRGKNIFHTLDTQ
jgi:hypothetical protein